MAGIAGSGKSTKVAEMKKADPSLVVLSSDELRAVYGKDENDLSVSSIVFKTMEVMTEYFLKRGDKVVIDATNRSIKSRAQFISIARKLNKPVKAVVVPVSLEQALRQNGGRARQVPNHVIEKMYKDFVAPVIGEVDEVEYAKTS